MFPASDGIVQTFAVGSKDHHHIYGLGRRAKFEKVRKFIQRAIKDNYGPNVFYTTFFDLYALPESFPGVDSYRKNPSDPTPYVQALESAFRDDILCHQFIPYIQLHEFETLLLADPDAFRISFENCDNAIVKLKSMIATFPSIEHIDDGQHTAPSKRIIDVIPEYRGLKSTAGPDIATLIGMANLRAKCPHFDRWIFQLERIP